MQQGSVLSISPKVRFLVWPTLPPVKEYQKYYVIRNLPVPFFPGLQVARHQLVIRILKEQ